MKTGLKTGGLCLRLPATSANLGPGFDAAGLALSLWLEIEARISPEYRIEAEGRDVALVGAERDNLILTTYQELAPAGPQLHLRIRNGIPLGKGCGSSAAALLAGAALANHFGELGWTPEQVRDEACRREGHPDNVAACFHGGFTVSALGETGRVNAASFGADLPWRGILAIPREALRTHVARALLPDWYSRADAVRNVQSTALLVAAFAQGRQDLLAPGTVDHLHQPFRLLPLRGQDGVCSVTLSGAGPSVLILLGSDALSAAVQTRIRAAAGELAPELVEVEIARGMKCQQVTEDT